MPSSLFSNILPFPPKVISRSPELYSNIEFSKDQKIELEKRRRNYLYKTLDYIISNLTYFDFCSLNAFEIIKKSKEISFFYKKEKVTLEFFFLSFFYSSFELNFLFEEYDIDKQEITELIEEVNQKSENILEKKPSFLKKLQTFFIQKKSDKKSKNEKNIENISFNEDVIVFFEKAAENALNRFKTPVITSEILFLTLLEEKNNYLGTILEKAINDPLKWELLKYKIIKRIHREESSLRDQVSKNQYYFAYLLKTQLTDNQFNQLINTEDLSKGVDLFRNTLIIQLLEINLFKLLELDIYKSMKITNTRKYSS